MKKFKIVVSLTTDDNDYQQEQAIAAEAAARKYGADLSVIYAENDSITQSQQLLKIIQSDPESRPDAIIFEPVGGTALPQVARAATAAGIGWVVLNRDADYIGDLRRQFRVPIFSITSDHEEIGRIQGHQFEALLPNGGIVLYIQGPTENLASKQRTAGMYGTKPDNIQIKALKGQWTEESSYRAVSSWLRLATSQEAHIDAIGAQDDSMAMGARKALQEHTAGAARDRWLSLPFTGCDGLPKTGQTWVRSGMLAATVVVPPNTDQAIEMVAGALQGNLPSERFATKPRSFPTLEELRKQKPKSFGASR